MKRTSTDVVVIGGGAAGMLASALIAERGFRTVVIERNGYTGKKLRITGKGRCNVTNDSDIKSVLENIPTGGRFLYSALSGFSPADVIAFFERLGVPLKTERGARVFPVSDKAEDVVNALRRFMDRNGVTLLKGRADAIETEDGRVCAVTSGGDRISCRAAILCTGGASYPMTGSDGDGYTIAAALGHTIVEPRPSLVPLECTQEFCRTLQGLSLKNVMLSAYDDKNKCLYSELGEMLFTHFGVSGPLVLSASAHLRDFTKHSYRLAIDMKPALDEKKLDARILRDFAESPNSDISNVLPKLVPRAMAPVIAEIAGISHETKVNSVTREERHSLVNVLKGLRLDISGQRPISEAIITSGGISLKEIDPKTMQSKIVQGLYFAGEVMDLDAYTGGFNLQIAWSTAHAAAEHIDLG